MVDILSVLNKPVFDENITQYKYHMYQPYASTTLNKYDEIRIGIQQSDLLTLPCESFLYIEGNITCKDNQNVAVTTNFPAFLFDEIRFELNGVEIDQIRNVGMTSLLKGLVSFSNTEDMNYFVSGFDYKLSRVYKNGDRFSFNLYLKNLLGFFEDYKKVLVNSKQELILVRSNTDLNCIKTDTDLEVTFNLEKVQWWIPHITISHLNKLPLLKMLDNNTNITCPYRQLELCVNPELFKNTRHNWNIKASNHTEKPLYIVLGFQTDRKNNFLKNISQFDNIDITNVKLYLNSEVYPYENLNLDFKKEKNISILYDMYAKFRSSYYRCEGNNCLLTYTDFKTGYPLIVIDCSHQNESIKSGTVDIRIEFETKSNVPDKTTAYCLIIHDKIIEYNPLTNVVTKIV